MKQLRYCILRTFNIISGLINDLEFQPLQNTISSDQSEHFFPRLEVINILYLDTSKVNRKS